MLATNKNQAGLISLAGSLQPLQEYFTRRPEQLQILALLSPT